MWYEEAVFYQVFPLGFCDGLRDNDGVMNRCISEFADWIPHLQKLGTDAVYFSPVFESDYHGYDTRDYRVIDKRIGTNKNFAELVSKLHEAGIKVVIDGVFNHVGRGFWAFCDVQPIRTGLTSALMAIHHIMTASGMRAGKDITIL